MIDIAFITNSADRDNLNVDDRVLWEYVQRSTQDESSALHGLHAEWLVWDDQEVDWSKVRHIVMRACYDYMEKLNAFKEWVHMVSDKICIPMWNEGKSLLWNVDKCYLRQLRDQHDIPIVPTLFITAGDENLKSIESAIESDQSLKEWIERLMHKQQWTRAVLKPSVANNATGTVFIDKGKGLNDRVLQQVRHVLQEFAPRCELMFQQFVDSISNRGETSVICFLGQPSHATRKVPPEGDFRVQLGTNTLSEATPEEMQLAEKVIRAAVRCSHGDNACTTPGDADHPILYARVDMLDSQLSELEILEPELYMRVVGDSGCQRFVDALAKKLKNKKKKKD